jgi:protein pelota
MKILRKDLKENTIKLRVETFEDLWHLEHIIEKGDLVTGKTFRKTTIKRGETIEYGERKPIILTIRAEKIDFQRDSGILRITGPIVFAPDNIRKQSYHTIRVDINSILSIRKLWKPHHLKRLEKSKVKPPLLLICVLDREEANFAFLKESGIEMKCLIENENKERMEDYYEKILNYLERQEGYQKIILAGPGFERENLFKFIQRKKSDLVEKIILEHSSSIGINGIHEVVKKSANKILKETRIAKECEYVQEVLLRMKTEGLVVYGREETQKAISMGAVEILLVSDKKIVEFEKLMERVERLKGKVVIIGSDHEMGEQFLHLGGIAGFLRFRIDY